MLIVALPVARCLKWGFRYAEAAAANGKIDPLATLATRRAFLYRGKVRGRHNCGVRGRGNRKHAVWARARGGKCVPMGGTRTVRCTCLFSSTHTYTVDKANLVA